MALQLESAFRPARPLIGPHPIIPSSDAMLVGILSDSHGDARATTRAVELLLERGARKLFHCGDLCGDGVLDALAGHDAYFVWGNCDDPTLSRRRYVQSIGLPLPEIPIRLEAAGKTINLFHGHESAFQEACIQPTTDYIFHGHTHQFAHRRINRCRIINPGALYRAAVHTVALLDLAADRLCFLRLDDGLEIQPPAR